MNNYCLQKNIFEKEFPINPDYSNIMLSNYLNQYTNIKKILETFISHNNFVISGNQNDYIFLDDFDDKFHQLYPTYQFPPYFDDNFNGCIPYIGEILEFLVAKHTKNSNINKMFIYLLVLNLITLSNGRKK